MKEACDLVLKTSSAFWIDSVEAILGQEASGVENSDRIGDEETCLEEVVDGEAHTVMQMLDALLRLEKRDMNWVAR